MTKNKNYQNKTVKLLSTQGSQLGEIELQGSVFGVEPNTHVMYLALKRQLNNARFGLASAKTRAEVSGGGKKPWKQKGTGRARAGSLRSPLFRGGGVIFGPKPRSFETALPQKERKLALKSALSSKFDTIKVVKDFSEINEPKTKVMVKALKDLDAQGKILIIADVTTEENKNLLLSARNIPSVKLLLPSNLNVKDIVEAQTIIVDEKSIDFITERLAK